MGQVSEIARRLNEGLPLTDEERLTFSAAEAAFKPVLKEFIERSAKVMETLRPALVKLPGMVQQFGQWTKAISEHLAPVLASMAVAFRELPPRLQSALLTLGESGWYLDGEWGLSELWQLEQLLLDGRAAEVDAILTKHYEDRLEAIEGFLVAALPKRKKILQAAFAAHRRGEFELSVPVLLAQTDGACLDITRYQFFIKASGKPQVALYVADVALDAFSEAMLSPLTNVLPVNASEKDRDSRVKAQGLATWQQLNRHQVLHGESTDYATQVNSLKVVSLINYLVGALARDGMAPT